MNTFYINITSDNTHHLPSRVLLVFARRNIEIRSMQTTSSDGMSRMQITIHESEVKMKNLQKQLQKIIGIHQVEFSTTQHSNIKL